MTIDLPLAILLPRKTKADKRLAMNLNVYRNTMFQILNQAKQQYKEEVADILLTIPHDQKKLTPPLLFHYTLYPKSKRMTDLGNVLSIVQKFTEDALVECGIIPDDNYLIIPKVIHSFGDVDKENPRVTLVIEEIR